MGSTTGVRCYCGWRASECPSALCAWNEDTVAGLPGRVHPLYGLDSQRGSLISPKGVAKARELRRIPLLRGWVHSYLSAQGVVLLPKIVRPVGTTDMPLAWCR